ncbi:MAG: PQQ-binding-like beta-propeller repeat protein [Gammaproteobacteria bacterium]|nr:PQQ-binding-like beta-propeller repeat protein [Gammaproteobacteria bacterium]
MSSAIALAVACGGQGSQGHAPRAESRRNEEPARVTTGDEVVPPPEVADLRGAAEAPAEPEIPSDTTDLASRVAPRRLHIPVTHTGRTSRFTFDGFHRGWLARLPNGHQHLLTPLYGDGKVFLGGGFSSHQMFAYDARTGEREWAAAASDGGPTAAILEDGKVIFNTESCTIFAVDARTGRQRWSRWLGDPLMSQPAAANGLVFSGHIVDGQSPGGLTPGVTGWGTGGGRRYAFSALAISSGAPRWTRSISADVMNAPVLDEDSVFFTTMDGVVYRLDQRTGQVRWRQNVRATSAPWLHGETVHVSVRASSEGGERRERAIILGKERGETVREHEPVIAEFLRGRPDGSVTSGWAYEGSRPSIVDGRIYQTIGDEVHCRDADTGELLWRRRYPTQVRGRPASPPAVAGAQLVFGTQDGVLFGLDIDTGMTTWAYDVGEPIAAQPTVAHGWVYAATTRGGLVGLEVSDASFDGWQMWERQRAPQRARGGSTPPGRRGRAPERGHAAPRRCAAQRRGRRLPAREHARDGERERLRRARLRRADVPQSLRAPRRGRLPLPAAGRRGRGRHADARRRARRARGDHAPRGGARRLRGRARARRAHEPARAGAPEPLPPVGGEHPARRRDPGDAQLHAGAALRGGQLSLRLPDGRRPALPARGRGRGLELRGHRAGGARARRGAPRPRGGDHRGRPRHGAPRGELADARHLRQPRGRAPRARHPARGGASRSRPRRALRGGGRRARGGAPREPALGRGARRLPRWPSTRAWR